VLSRARVCQSWPFFMPLSTGLRGRKILRSSSIRGSRWPGRVAFLLLLVPCGDGS
jgi:hypothetical protein